MQTTTNRPTKAATEDPQVNRLLDSADLRGIDRKIARALLLDGDATGSADAALLAWGAQGIETKWAHDQYLARIRRALQTCDAMQIQQTLRTSHRNTLALDIDDDLRANAKTRQQQATATHYGDQDGVSPYDLGCWVEHVARAIVDETPQHILFSLRELYGVLWTRTDPRLHLWERVEALHLARLSADLDERVDADEDVRTARRQAANAKQKLRAAQADLALYVRTDAQAPLDIAKAEVASLSDTAPTRDRNRAQAHLAAANEDATPEQREQISNAIRNLQDTSHLVRLTRGYQYRAALVAKAQETADYQYARAQATEATTRATLSAQDAQTAQERTAHARTRYDANRLLERARIARARRALEAIATPPAERKIDGYRAASDACTVDPKTGWRVWTVSVSDAQRHYNAQSESGLLQADKRAETIKRLHSLARRAGWLIEAPEGCPMVQIVECHHPDPRRQDLTVGQLATVYAREADLPCGPSRTGWRIYLHPTAEGKDYIGEGPHQERIGDTLLARLLALWPDATTHTDSMGRTYLHRQSSGEATRATEANEKRRDRSA